MPRRLGSERPLSLDVRVTGYEDRKGLLDLVVLEFPREAGLYFSTTPKVPAHLVTPRDRGLIGCPLPPCSASSTSRSTLGFGTPFGWGESLLPASPYPCRGFSPNREMPLLAAPGLASSVPLPLVQGRATELSVINLHPPLGNGVADRYDTKNESCYYLADRYVADSEITSLVKSGNSSRMKVYQTVGYEGSYKMAV